MGIALLLALMIVSTVYSHGDEIAPDLAFQGLIEISGGSSGEIRSGDVITIFVKVINTGGTDAENVDVTLFIDNVRVRTQVLHTVKSDPEDVKTVIFSWVAETGSHIIEVRLDPDGSIPESDETNNVITRSIDVASTEEIIETTSSVIIIPWLIPAIICLILIILAIPVLLIIIIILLSKRR